MKSDYITREGWLALDCELKYLWKEERPKVTLSVSDAAALGDRSENAEYIYGKKRLREIDRRVRYLTKRLATLKIVDYHPTQEGKIFFGAWVTVENAENQSTRFRIVGSDELNPNKKWISIHSPVARALIGKQVGDSVDVHTPNGEISYLVLNVDYSAV